MQNIENYTPRYEKLSIVFDCETAGQPLPSDQQATHIQEKRHSRTWDKAIIDRTDELRRRVQLCRQYVAERKVKRLFLFGNNHYQGHGPDTVKTFWELWKD
jgi:hypothetical protein